MRTRPRLIDVARLAGVSTATVSAVINDNLGPNIRVSPETRQKVLDAIASLGYVANPAARNLAGGQNRLLGIFTYEAIFPIKFHDFYYPFLLGIEEEAEAQRYNLLLFTSVVDQDGRRSIFHNDTNVLWMADGAVLMGLNENKLELSRLQKEGYPFVFVGRREVPDVEISFSAADYIRATETLTTLLFQAGHRRLVYFCMTHDIESGRDRETGFCRAHEQNGIPLAGPGVIRIHPKDITPEVVEPLLRDGITGAITENDDLLHYLMVALESLGLSVPEHFSLALLGDPHNPWPEVARMTRFSIPRREMGIHAVRFLIQRLEHPEEVAVQNVYLPCTILHGQSIAAPNLPTIFHRR